VCLLPLVIFRHTVQHATLTPIFFPPGVRTNNRVLLRDGGAATMHREYVVYCNIDAHQRNELLHGGSLCLMAVNRRTSKHMIFDDGLSKAMLMSPKLFLRRNSSPKSTNSPISQSSSPSRSLWHAKRASMPRKHTNGVCKVSAA